MWGIPDIKKLEGMPYPLFVEWIAYLRIKQDEELEDMLEARAGAGLEKAKSKRGQIARG